MKAISGLHSGFKIADFQAETKEFIVCSAEGEEFLFTWERNVSDHDSRHFFLENVHKNFPLPLE